MRAVFFCLTLMLATSPSVTPCSAQEAIGLAAPPPVTDSGLLKHILPRFSLKTGVRVVTDEAGAMQLATDPPGDPVFARGAVVYRLRTQDRARQHRFRDWLLSDIGKRTIEGFQPVEGDPFSASFEVVAVEEKPTYDGDAQRGAELSLTHCGRCHVVGPENRMGGLGSTPSFAVLRSLKDWPTRFEQFFALNPHPAFTQVAGVTPPFDPERPSPIFPVQITMDDLDAILAFVADTDAADLGAPLIHQ